MNRLKTGILLIILIIGFVVRLYRLNNPVADWHEWRQADTSAVSRNFVKHGIDLLYPKYDDLSNVASGLENPQGYRFVEFPIYNFFQAEAFMLFGKLTLEEWGRIASILSSLASAMFLYLIIKRKSGELEGILSAFFFLFLPFSIYYSRTILPDEMMVSSILGGIYFFNLWIDRNAKLSIYNLEFVLALIFTAASFLLKPYALFFTLPIIYLTFKELGLSFLRKWQLWLFLILSIAPLILWRVWMQQFPEGIPVSSWLFNGNNIRFKGSFFYWIFADRLSRLILGYFGVAILFFGLLKKELEKDYFFPMTFLFSSLIYLFVIATGNVQHDYYQILIIPTVSILLARGVSFLLSLKDKTNKRISYVLIPILIFGMISFSWYYIRDYFNINNWSIVEAGQKADGILPKDAKVIAPYDGDTAFLYQTNRAGWPVFEKPIGDLIKMGAQYLVIAAPTKNDFNGFGRQYQIVASSSSYLILKL